MEMIIKMSFSTIIITLFKVTENYSVKYKEDGISNIRMSNCNVSFHNEVLNICTKIIIKNLTILKAKNILEIYSQKP